MKVEVGFGLDVYQLVEGHKPWLGSILLEHEKGLLGHLDVDVLVHAICDVLLGAVNVYNIGYHFSDNAGEYRNIDSRVLLKKTVELVITKGYQIGNADVTICAECPKLKAHIPSMQQVLAEVMDINADGISIEATTIEKPDSIEREGGISAYATVLINRV